MTDRVSNRLSRRQQTRNGGREKHGHENLHATSTLAAVRLVPHIRRMPDISYVVQRPSRHPDPPHHESSRSIARMARQSFVPRAGTISYARI